MINRPGGTLATRPLHFIWICDCSGSMAGEKINQLNFAIKEALPAMRKEADENPNAQVFVRALKFSKGAEWINADPVPVEQFQWADLTAGGPTDMGKALSMVADALTIPPMTERALPPVLVLVSDGQPTDDLEKGLARLLEVPWGKKAVRLAIAIGKDADRDVLAKFIGNAENPAVRGEQRRGAWSGRSAGSRRSCSARPRARRGRPRRTRRPRTSQSPRSQSSSWRRRARMTSGRGWDVLSASVIGAAHTRAGRPNQDAAGCWWSEDGTVVLAVADGHGGEAYVPVGPRGPVRGRGGHRGLPRPRRPPSAHGNPGRGRAREARPGSWPARSCTAGSGAWRRTGTGTTGRSGGPDPPAAGAGGDDAGVRTTLIVALAVGAELVLLLQCGDGDVLAVAGDGTRGPAGSRRTTRSFGNETASLCLPEAWTEFRSRLLDTADSRPCSCSRPTGTRTRYTGDGEFRQVARDLL